MFCQQHAIYNFHAMQLTVKFPNPTSTIVQVIEPPTATEAMYLHRQPCIPLNESNPTPPKTNPAKIQLSQFLYETIVHKHPNRYEKDVDCDHPCSLLAMSPFLTWARSLASLTHSLTLDCGSLRLHALSTGRKMKKYR